MFGSTLISFRWHPTITCVLVNDNSRSTLQMTVQFDSLHNKEVHMCAHYMGK